MSCKTRSIVPLTIPPDLKNKVERAAKLLGKSEAETMRIAMEIGLERLALWNYKLYAGLAADPPAALKVAETPEGNASFPSIPAVSAAIKYPAARTRKKSG